MNVKKNYQLLRVLFISIVLMACSFTANVTPTTITPTITSTNTPEATPTITVTSTPYYKVKADKIITVKSGGFSFAEIKGYSVFRSDNIGVYLINPDKKVELGILAYPRPGGSAITGLMSSWREGFGHDFDNINFADPIEETKNDVASISAEFSGMDGEVPYQGILKIQEPPNSKIIYLYIIAYGDQRWQREGQKVFNATTKSMIFFEITAMKNCPITKNKEYGFNKKNPIKIGGGDENERLRINNYLSALLSPKGEIVSYAVNKSIKYGRVNLDTYEIRIGNDYKTLYFDRTNFEELHVPYGLSCSAPLPEKPDKGDNTNG